VTPLPHTGWQLKAQFLTAERLNHSQVDRWETYLDADVVGSEAVLRPRRAGDTFMPLGLGGHSQKVTDFMINEKIPATWRNQIPLLVSANQILWVCGYRLDERARLRPTTRRILHLKFEPQ
jgi:tRNA(Ile)-lysidine synthase